MENDLTILWGLIQSVNPRQETPAGFPQHFQEMFQIIGIPTIFFGDFAWIQARLSYVIRRTQKHSEALFFSFNFSMGPAETMW